MHYLAQLWFFLSHYNVLYTNKQTEVFVMYEQLSEAINIWKMIYSQPDDYLAFSLILMKYKFFHVSLTPMACDCVLSNLF